MCRGITAAGAIRGAVNGMMLQVIEGHLTDHVVKEPEEDQREGRSWRGFTGDQILSEVEGVLSYFLPMP